MGGNDGSGFLECIVEMCVAHHSERPGSRMGRRLPSWLLRTGPNHRFNIRSAINRNLSSGSPSVPLR
nr:hypothetical protein Iba_chr07eCG2300 [Ipomoea batatas]